MLREDIMGHVTVMVAEEIKEGSAGVVVTSDESADGFYLVTWSVTPFTDQETGELLCEGKYFLGVFQTQVSKRKKSNLKIIPMNFFHRALP